MRTLAPERSSRAKGPVMEEQISFRTSTNRQCTLPQMRGKCASIRREHKTQCPRGIFAFKLAFKKRHSEAPFINERIKLCRS
jgi:hypothetical protein